MELINSLIYVPIIYGCLKFIIKQKSLQYILNENVFMLVMLGIFIAILLQQPIDTINITYQQEWFFNLIGLKYSLSLNGLSLIMLGLTWVVFCVVAFELVAVFELKENTSFSSLFFVMYGLINGAFLADNSLLFFLFFEATMVPLFLIIGIWGGENRIYATIKFMLYTLISSLFLLISFLYLAKLTHTQLGAGVDLFALHNLYQLNIPIETQKVLFWLLSIAFMVKVPMLGVHTWLPNAHVEAPTLGSIVLAAITLKLGAYGMLKYVLPIVPLGAHYYANLFIGLSCAAIVYIAVLALSQQNIKKLIAYSSISHMGFVTLALFLMFKLPTNEQQQLLMQGAIIVMVSHGLVSSALFGVAGVLINRFQHKDMNLMRNVVKQMPLFSSLSLFFILANCGFPGTSGFIGEFLIILAATYTNNWLIITLCASSVLLGAIYSLNVYRKVFWRTDNNNYNNHNNNNHNNNNDASVIAVQLTDLTLKASIPYVFLSLLILWLGLNPNTLFSISDLSTKLLLTNIFR